MTEILVPIAPGELIDKLTILRIKSERITDPAKLANVETEKTALEEVANGAFALTPALEDLWDQLYRINSDLWEIEDDIRNFEARSDFGKGFIALARSVYFTNDKRAEVKKAINLLLGSALVEEKSYSDYGEGGV